MFNKINKGVHLAMGKSLLHNASYNCMKINKGRNCKENSKSKGESARKGAMRKSEGNCRRVLLGKGGEGGSGAEEERYDVVDTGMFVKMTEKDEKVKGIEQLNEIKSSLDDNLKVMFDFSYECFLNRESECESRRSFDEGNTSINTNRNRITDKYVCYKNGNN